jgi:hypothetical protein
MALSTYNIAAEQGSNYLASIAYTDDDGDIVNLTGYTSRMQVRKFAGSLNAILSLTNTAGMTISASAGTIELSISADALRLVPEGEYVYDLEIVSGSGVVTKLLQGTFDVDAEVTR